MHVIIILKSRKIWIITNYRKENGLIQPWRDFIFKLAWKPSSAKVTKRLGSLKLLLIIVLLRRCITPAVYPHLNDFTGKLKVDPVNLKTKLRTFPWVSWVPPIKIWSKSVQGFLSYDRTNKQTNRQTEITTLYIDTNLKTRKLFPSKLHSKKLSESFWTREILKVAKKTADENLCWIQKFRRSRNISKQILDLHFWKWLLRNMHSRFHASLRRKMFSYL